MTPKSDNKKAVRRVIIVSAVTAIVVIAYIAESKFLPLIAINQLSELTNTRVKADSVTFSLNGSVLIRGLQIKPSEQLPQDSTILWARKVYIRFGLGSLILLKPQVKKISVHDFHIDLQQDMDSGRWNIETMKLAKGKGGGKLPTVRLKNGQIRYSKRTGNKIKTTVEIPIDVSLEHSKEVRNAYQFELATARTDERQLSRIFGIYEPGHLVLGGSISSEDLPWLEQTWSINDIAADYKYDKSGKFALELRIQDFVTEDRTAARMILEKPQMLKNVGAASAIARVFEQYRLAGTVDLNLQAEGNLKELAKTKLTGTITCKDVSILYSVFPYFIENIKGTIDFSDEAIKINNLAGRHGDVNLTIGGGFSDFGSGTRGQIEIRSRNMVLDEDLYEALLPVQKKLWDDFEPNGIVEFDYTLHREPQKRNQYWLDVDLVDVNSTYRKFPYPMDNLTGNLFFDHNSIKVTNLNAKKLSSQININGKVIDTDTAKPRFDLVIDVNNIPLDDVLANALPMRERNLYEQFNPSGSGKGRILISNETEDVNKADFAADLNFTDTILRPPMLPLPITDINANGIFKPDLIEFKRFRGIYAGQPVSMEGTFQPTEDGNDLTYAMVLSSSDVRIDKELLNLIPERMRDAVRKLNPSGQIAYTARLNKQVEVNDIDFEVTVDCQGIAARPEVLGLVLEGITGKITVNKNVVVLDNLTSRAKDRNSPSVKMDGIIEMSGSVNDGAGGIVAALVDIDANNFPIAEKRIYRLKTRLDYDKDKDVWKADSFVGNFYGGRMAGQIRIEVEPGKKSYFELQSGFEGADLRKFLADGTKLPENCPDANCFSTGSMSGRVNISGRVDDTSSYFGTCKIDIEGMQVGKVSLVARLLSLLKLTEPGDHVFDRMSFDAYIKDGRFYFETLELSGAALTFAGSGWMDMTSKKLDLTLAVRGPRISAIKENIIESLATAISPAVLQVVVTGNAYEPQIEVKPFPVIGNTLELFGTKE